MNPRYEVMEVKNSNYWNYMVFDYKARQIVQYFITKYDADAHCDILIRESRRPTLQQIESMLYNIFVRPFILTAALACLYLAYLVSIYKYSIPSEAANQLVLVCGAFLLVSMLVGAILFTIRYFHEVKGTE